VKRLDFVVNWFRFKKFNLLSAIFESMQLGIDSGQPTKMTHPFYTVCSILNNNEIGAQLIRKLLNLLLGIPTVFSKSFCNGRILRVMKRQRLLLS
jgi:hypothetical protein